MELSGNVSLGKPTTAIYSEAATLRFTLNPAVRSEWVQFFEEADHPPELAQPELIGNTEIKLRVPHDQLEEAVAALRNRVEIANSRFEREVTPRLKAEADESLRQEQAKEKLEAEIQRKIDALFPD